MTRILALCSCLVGLATWGNTASKATSEADFEQANRLYEEGRFVEAIQAYLPLRTNHPTLAVHFNLGNAYFKSGDLGEAVAEYYEASRLAPRDPDVRANLRFAAARVPGPSYRPGWLQQQAQTLTQTEWVTIATGMVWLFCLVQICRQFNPRWQAGLRPWSTFCGILAGVVVASALWACRMQAQNRLAVVVARDAVMRLGPFDEAQSALELKGGAALRVLDRKNGWIQVAVDQQQTGWVPQAAVRVIDP